METTTRRDFLLREMGISQWRLRRPDVLKGAVNIPVAEHIRLVVIAEQEVDPHDNLVRDILRSARLEVTDCLFVSVGQADYLNVRHSPVYWRLGENREKTDRTFSSAGAVSPRWQSPALSELKKSPQAKRALWREIQTLLAEQEV